MILDDSDKGLGFLLAETARLHRKLVDRRLQPYGLTRAQWAVLAILAHRDGMTQSELADDLEIEKSTVGRLIDHLEAAGLVERRAASADRRLWRLHLMGAAHPLVERVADLIRNTRSDMLNGLSAEQQRVLATALAAVKTNLARACGGEAGAPLAPAEGAGRPPSA